MNNTYFSLREHVYGRSCQRGFGVRKAQNVTRGVKGATVHSLAAKTPPAPLIVTATTAESTAERPPIATFAVMAPIAGSNAAS